MSGKQERKFRPEVDREGHTTDPEQPQSESVARAEEVSTTTEDVVDDIDKVLDDVDQSLIAMLFEPGEVVDPVELERRAEEMVAQYQQKGGQ